MVEGAVYDAVDALQPDHRPYLLDLQALHAQPFGSQAAAIATAAHDVLVKIVAPGAPVDAVNAKLKATLDPIPEARPKPRASASGQLPQPRCSSSARTTGTSCRSRSTSASTRATGGPSAGPTHRARPRRLGREREAVPHRDPVAVPHEGAERAHERAYEKDFAEVKSLGAIDSTTRTADQTAAAVFWQFPPIALWNQLARDQLTPRFGLDTADQARLYAIINLAAADAAINCWNDKYHWSFWRPRAAIREAGTDGNPATVPDPNWESLFAPATQTTPPLGTPPFPDHPWATAA